MTLGDSIQAFESSELMASAIPADLRDIFLQLKRDEWARYCGIITEWEMSMYWETTP
jgi:glutamine synthetase